MQKTKLGVFFLNTFTMEMKIKHTNDVYDGDMSEVTNLLHFQLNVFPFRYIERQCSRLRHVDGVYVLLNVYRIDTA